MCVTAHSRKGIGLHVLGTLTTTAAISVDQGMLRTYIIGGTPLINFPFKKLVICWKSLVQNVSNVGGELLVQVQNTKCNHGHKYKVQSTNSNTIIAKLAKDYFDC